MITTSIPMYTFLCSFFQNASSHKQQPLFKRIQKLASHLVRGSILPITIQLASIHAQKKSHSSSLSSSVFVTFITCTLELLDVFIFKPDQCSSKRIGIPSLYSFVSLVQKDKLTTTNLPWSLLDSDQSKLDVATMEMHRCALAIIYTGFISHDQIIKSTSVPEVSLLLGKWVRKYASLDFLDVDSLGHFLCLFLSVQSRLQEPEFMPQTTMKIIETIQSSWKHACQMSSLDEKQTWVVGYLD